MQVFCINLQVPDEGMVDSNIDTLVWHRRVQDTILNCLARSRQVAKLLNFDHVTACSAEQAYISCSNLATLF